jgi:hypothetical protein
MKAGNEIKIHTTNKGDLHISFEELRDRIGTGSDYLRLLTRRPPEFKIYLFSEAKKQSESEKDTGVMRIGKSKIGGSKLG